MNRDSGPQTGVSATEFGSGTTEFGSGRIPGSAIPDTFEGSPEIGVVLDPDDPFDAAVIPLVLTNRRKRADYATDSDPFSNFRFTASLMAVPGFGPTESALFNVTQKLARLKALRENGRMKAAQNEAVGDTYLDLAVYAVILLAIHQQESSS